MGGLPRGQLPLQFSTVQADLAEQVVAGEVQQMQVLLDVRATVPSGPAMAATGISTPQSLHLRGVFS